MDTSNIFVIDSLAIAPSQLKLSLVTGESFIESLSEQLQTLINDEHVSRKNIGQGDKMHIGKHSLIDSNATA